jgi:hypothetical protein
MTHNSANHIGVALLPTPLILLNFPGIYNVAHKIQGLAGVVFEKIIESFCLTVTGTEVYIRNED